MCRRHRVTSPTELSLLEWWLCSRHDRESPTRGPHVGREGPVTRRAQAHDVLVDVAHPLPHVLQGLGAQVADGRVLAVAAEHVPRDGYVHAGGAQRARVTTPEGVVSVVLEAELLLVDPSELIPELLLIFLAHEVLARLLDTPREQIVLEDDEDVVQAREEVRLVDLLVVVARDDGVEPEPRRHRPVEPDLRAQLDRIVALVEVGGVYHLVAGDHRVLVVGVEQRVDLDDHRRSEVVQTPRELLVGEAQGRFGEDDRRHPRRSDRLHDLPEVRVDGGLAGADEVHRLRAELGRLADDLEAPRERELVGESALLGIGPRVALGVAVVAVPRAVVGHPLERGVEHAAVVHGRRHLHAREVPSAHHEAVIAEIELGREIFGLNDRRHYRLLLSKKLSSDHQQFDDHKKCARRRRSFGGQTDLSSQHTSCRPAVIGEQLPLHQVAHRLAGALLVVEDVTRTVCVGDVPLIARTIAVLLDLRAVRFVRGVEPVPDRHVKSRTGHDHEYVGSLASAPELIAELPDLVTLEALGAEQIRDDRPLEPELARDHRGALLHVAGVGRHDHDLRTREALSDLFDDPLHLANAAVSELVLLLVAVPHDKELLHVLFLVQTPPLSNPLRMFVLNCPYYHNTPLLSILKVNYFSYVVHKFNILCYKVDTKAILC